ncbi:MAG: hypothetical protein ACFFEN_09740 [Candidatus Thorarchaeota archaeon]
MTEKLDLKKLEKKAWRSTFQDGLWDIYFGLLILGMGIYSIGSPEVWVSMLIIIIWDLSAFIFFYAGKKLITIPRIGYVKFGKKRKTKKIKLTIFLAFMVVLNVILLFISFTGLNIKLNPYIFTFVVGTAFVTLPICVVAYFLEFKRLYLIGIMAGLGLFISELLYPFLGAPLNATLTFCVIGCIITIWGFVFFIKFLKEYPLPKVPP